MSQKDRPSTQDYGQLRRRCLAKGKLFEDSEFPAVRESLFYSGGGPKQKLEWKRPHEICTDPQLFVGGASRFDVAQGMLGDCWFVAVLSSLAQEQTLLHQVVPPEQSFDDHYAGIFHFRFWRFGEWIDVVVDDLLPTYCNKLIFIHSEEKNEFWSALLEKAYAKLHGSYEALKGGKAAEAMVDFTGGVTETIDLKKPPAKLFRNLLTAAAAKSLMSCSIGAKTRKDMEAKMDNGLVMGHAYSVTDIKQVRLENGKEAQLIRIRNPWGNEREWTGAWSDDSAEWKQISPAERQRLGLEFDDDGESWMSWDDFKANFTEMEVCSLSADDLDEDTPTKTFKSSMAQAKWAKGKSAGGCRNFPTFEKNPQFIVDLSEADDGDEDGLCSVVFAVMQKDRRAKRHLGAQDLCVGLSIYKVPDDFSGQLDKKYFDYHKSTATSGSFTNLREVVCRLDLGPGRYVLIPCTFNPDEEASFLMRIFSEKSVKPKGNDSQQSTAGFDARWTEMFKRVAGRDGAVDAEELQELLTCAMKNELRGQRLPLDVCRALISFLDKDYNGKLNEEEFGTIFDLLLSWRTTFKKYDRSRMGKMASADFLKALGNAGCKPPATLATRLCRRYAKSDNKVVFEDFVNCLVRIDTIKKQIEKRGKGGRMSDDELMQWAVVI
eukprot:m.3059 g.3059  ORF g.3059 m.3059 type:complete len:660 (+) comp9038_c0_seq1:64-2043(+)